jgi:hypothetical protein
MDDGRTWEKSPADPNAALPLAANGQGTAPVHGSVTVQLNKEAAVYGFYLVVRSRAGLGKPPPRPGDLPLLRVEVDTTPPDAKLFKPQADPSHPDALLLTWEANDPHLATNPISLEWAPRKEGPWEYIGDTQLPNTGRYTWKVPANVPPSVFLRLQVRDQAGNTAVAVTPEPELVDLTVPEVSGISLGGNR